MTERLSVNTSITNKELGDVSIPKKAKTMPFHLWPQVLVTNHIKISSPNAKM